MGKQTAMASDPQTFLFDDDGETPNNPRLPLILYRAAVPVQGTDPAAAFERTFARHGWKDGWRNGIFDFLHFHIQTHEVLGIARGTVKVELGGSKGQQFDLAAGDVAILPAGCGHRRISASRDLLVVGAYPDGGSADHQTPGRTSHGAAVTAIAHVPVPDQDPVFGKDGPLTTLWR